MAEDELSEAAKAEKLAAARKRFEQLKKQQQASGSSTLTGTAKKKTTTAKKKKTDKEKAEFGGDANNASDEEAAAATVPAEAHAKSSATSVGKTEGDKELRSNDDNELAGLLQSVRVENAALRDSLATANAKIQADAVTITALESEIASLKINGSNSGINGSNKNAEFYKSLEEKFSREAQERYLLEKDYAALEKTHNKLLQSHQNLVSQMEALKTQFGAEEKLRQLGVATSMPTSPPPPFLSSETRSRLSVGTSSLFKTAQGLSAAVVKGVTGSASAVIGDVTTNRRNSRGLSVSASEYADVDLFESKEGEEEEDDDDEAYERGLTSTDERVSEREKSIQKLQEESRQRQEWIKTEMEKWKGYQLDLVRAGGSVGGIGEIIEV
ncbi:hypothetical protein V1511DRAFT_488159 [Dipodascopsis uninucleata]